MNSLTHLKICIIFLNFDVLKCIKYDCGLISRVRQFPHRISSRRTDYYQYPDFWLVGHNILVCLILKVEVLDGNRHYRQGGGISWPIPFEGYFWPCTHMCPWPIYIMNNVLILMKATKVYQHFIPEMRFHTHEI